MRLLVETFIAAALIYLGWEKPFKQWGHEMRAKVTSKEATAASQETAPTPRGAWMWTPDHPGALDRSAASDIATAPPPAAPAPSRPGAWMWDPNHRSTLDRPAYDQTGPSGAAPSGTPRRYQDASGRTYWIDAQGVPHYDQ